MIYEWYLMDSTFDLRVAALFDTMQPNRSSLSPSFKHSIIGVSCHAHIAHGNKICKLDFAFYEIMKMVVSLDLPFVCPENVC